MNTYIALLRGINVSGQKTMPMAELRNHLGRLGLKDVQTYIQSGNVVFRTQTNETGLLSQSISRMIREEYGYEVRTWIVEPSELKNLLDHHPYAADHPGEGNRLFVCFLSGTPDEAPLQALSETQFENEFFKLAGKYIYMYYPGGIGPAKTNNNYFEAALKIEATTRNLNTINKLYRMSQNLLCKFPIKDPSE